MFRNTVKLRPEGDKFFIAVPVYGFGVEPWREPELKTREGCEKLLRDKGYEFMYKSKIGDWEVWGIPIKDDSR